MIGGSPALTGGDLVATAAVVGGAALAAGGAAVAGVSALAAGGAYSFETGLKMVCQRSIALQPLRAAGKMAAVSCGAEQAAKLIQASGGRTLEIAVVNHDRQTVISGEALELRALGEAALGLSVEAARSLSRRALTRV